MDSGDAQGARMWALVGEKAGDNAQVLALAQAVGIPFEEKRIRYNGRRVLPNWLLGATLTTTSAASRPQIAPPWPDIVVASGQRSVPVARKIKRESGGRTRLVQIGRPRAPLSWFDLVVTTPQYGLPPRDNVVHLDLPFQGKRNRDVGSEWNETLPPGEPRIGLLVGGDIGPYRFDAHTIDALADGALALCTSRNARLVVTSGRRLPVAAGNRLRDATRENCAIFHAVEDDGTNPYAAILARADEFVVTTDSVSMIADAVGAGQPLHLFSPSLSPPISWRLIDGLAKLVGAVCPRGLHDALVARGLVIPPRRTELVAMTLVANGDAAWLGDEPPEKPTDASDRAATHASLLERIRALGHGSS
jgi:mitochondrial fission protein ELM1